MHKILTILFLSIVLFTACDNPRIDLFSNLTVVDNTFDNSTKTDNVTDNNSVVEDENLTDNPDNENMNETVITADMLQGSFLVDNITIIASDKILKSTDSFVTMYKGEVRINIDNNNSKIMLSGKYQIIDEGYIADPVFDNLKYNFFTLEKVINLNNIGDPANNAIINISPINITKHIYRYNYTTSNGVIIVLEIRKINRLYELLDDMNFWVTRVNMKDNIKSLAGHYEIFYFKTSAVVMGTTNSASFEEPDKIQHYKGEMAIKVSPDAKVVSITSKLQMDSSFLRDFGQSAAQYTFNPYDDYAVPEDIKSNPRLEKPSEKITITQHPTFLNVVMTKQKRKEKVLFLTADVTVDIWSLKIRNDYREIVNSKYW